MTRPACRAGLSFQGGTQSWARLLLLACAGCFLAAACGDSHGLYARYQLEKQFFEVQQALSRSELQAKSGAPLDRQELRAQMTAVLKEFMTVRPSLGPGDSVLFGYAAQTAFRLTEAFIADRMWHDASHYQEFLATDTLFPIAIRHRALYGWGECNEQLGRVAEAAAIYKRLTASFYPPWSEGGVKVEVLRLPNRILALAQRDLPDSVEAFRTYSMAYYDSLANTYPHSDLAFQSLGELGKVYGQAGLWKEAMTTLQRATDTSGAMVPAYRIDRGEILASQMHDTSAALAIFKDISESLAETPYRVDADLKTAAILYRRGRQADVQALLSATKKHFEGKGGVQVSVGPLLARSFAASGDRDRARAEYSYLVGTYPRTLQAVEAAIAIAELYAKSSEQATADEWYGRADQLAADLAGDRGSTPQILVAALNIRASLAVQSQRWDDAVSRLSEIAQTFSVGTPAGAAALVQLGWLQLRERHDTLAASQAWQAVLTAHPDQPEAEPLRTEMSKWPEKFRNNATS